MHSPDRAQNAEFERGARTPALGSGDVAAGTTATFWRIMAILDRELPDDTIRQLQQVLAPPAAVNLSPPLMLWPMVRRSATDERTGVIDTIIGIHTGGACDAIAVLRQEIGAILSPVHVVNVSARLISEVDHVED
jgi:hypothetical protein